MPCLVLEGRLRNKFPQTGTKKQSRNVDAPGRNLQMRTLQMEIPSPQGGRRSEETELIIGGYNCEIGYTFGF